jgi:tripartite-type tricarboxylate transporter receptor subunit TctC
MNYLKISTVYGDVMMTNFNRRTALCASWLALAVPSVWAQAGAAVSKIIVPFAAGGARELPARAIQNELSKELGQNWIIEARPGAGGAMGTVQVAHAAPDGKTLLMAASSHFVTAALGSKPSYDPVKDFIPVANIGNQSYVVIVSSSLPVKSVGELIAYAKAHPDALNYNSAGIGSSTHLAMAYFAQSADIKMLHVPYKGTQEAVNDVIGGQSQAVMVPTAGVEKYLQEPRLRVLALTARRRSALLPQLPTVSESGLPNFVFDSWFGLLAPAGTSMLVVEKINAAVNKVIQIPEVKNKLLKMGMETGQQSQQSFTKQFLADHVLMTKIVKLTNLSAN